MHKIGLLPFTAWLMSDKRHSWCWHPPHSHPGSADIFSDLQLVQTSCIFSNFYNFFIFYNIFDFFNVSRFCTTLHLLQLVQLLHLVCNLASSLRPSCPSPPTPEDRCAPHKKSIHITLVDLIARWSNMKWCAQTGNFHCLPEQSCWLLLKFYRKNITDLMIW